MSAIQLMNDEQCALFESSTLAKVGSNSIYDDYYQEAVFTHGKETIKPIEKCIEKLRKELLDQLGMVEDENGKIKQSYKSNFNYNKFFKSYNFKDLEDELKKVFGFRSVDIYPLEEDYISKDKEFWYNYINAYTTMILRYHIDGLVTEKGFYDSTHSISLVITFTNTAIKDLTPSEFMACLLHEIGHNIDPAIVDIKYTQVNVLSKYLTDRKNKITNAERKALEKNGKSLTGDGVVALLYFGVVLFYVLMVMPWKKIWRGIVNGIKNLFHIKITDEEIKERIDRIKKEAEKDKTQFNRQSYSEAFADNFARMYGYGKELALLLKKIDKDSHTKIKSWYSKERSRQEAIVEMITNALNDEHKTEIARIQNLIREYEEDLKDKNLPKQVKKNMQNDLNELKAVYDSYTDDFDDFYKRCVEMMKDQLVKKDEIVSKENEKENSKKDSKPHNESVEETFEEKSLITDKNDKKQMKEIINKGRIAQIENRSFSWPWFNNTKKEETNSENEKRCKKAMKKLYDDTKVNCIKLTPGKKSSHDDIEKRFDTKFGGIPAWPKNMEWPSYSQEREPMICLAQLNFDKLPKLENYPDTGILQFFTNINYDSEICKVIYHKNINKNNLLEQVPISTLNKDKIEELSMDGYDYFPIKGVYYPTAKIAESAYINYDNEYTIDGNYTKINYKLYEEYLKKEFGDNISNEIDHLAYTIYNELINYGNGCRIGGWPNFTQSDVRDKNHDILLLQIDSGNGIMWGDYGVANFFISMKNLKNKNFDDVLFTWDCM